MTTLSQRYFCTSLVSFINVECEPVIVILRLWYLGRLNEFCPRAHWKQLNSSYLCNADMCPICYKTYFIVYVDSDKIRVRDNCIRWFDRPLPNTQVFIASFRHAANNNMWSSKKTKQVKQIIHMYDFSKHICITDVLTLSEIISFLFSISLFTVMNAFSAV